MASHQASWEDIQRYSGGLYYASSKLAESCLCALGVGFAGWVIHEANELFLCYVYPYCFSPSCTIYPMWSPGGPFGATDPERVNSADENHESLSHWPPILIQMIGQYLILLHVWDSEAHIADAIWKKYLGLTIEVCWYRRNKIALCWCKDWSGHWLVTWLLCPLRNDLVSAMLPRKSNILSILSPINTS